MGRDLENTIHSTGSSCQMYLTRTTIQVPRAETKGSSPGVIALVFTGRVDASYGVCVEDVAWWVNTRDNKTTSTKKSQEGDIKKN